MRSVAGISLPTKRKLAPAERGPSQRYFTDGTNLYRFIAWMTDPDEASFAAVEECRSLDILIVSAEQLGAAPLRPVPTRSR